VSEKRKTKERLQRSDPRAGKEVLLLWAILGEGGLKGVSRSALNDKGMLPSDDKAARNALDARGLIKVEKRKSLNENGRSISGYWMTVTKPDEYGRKKISQPRQLRRKLPRRSYKLGWHVCRRFCTLAICR
jgi:hypothetical protein